jgi:hypothetical protein
MNRRLAEAVLATFRDEDEAAHRRQLADFGVHDWRRTLHWLDASGLALYFLDRLKSLGLEGTVPFEILTGLESRLADNRQRTAGLFQEFLRVNRAFQGAGLRYVNLKGFTLVPDYCSDLSLRSQFDLDFLASSADALRYRDILETFGYVITGRGENILEFKAGSSQVPSVHDLYKKKPQRSVEVHFVPSPQKALGVESGPLTRSRNHVWSGAVFPALSDTDMFLAQAHHLFRHVRSEWMRISWLLEFKTFVVSRRADATFWRDVHNRTTATADGTLSSGAAIWLATEAFGDFAPHALIEWSVDTIPTSTRLWLERYGKKVLLSDFPGTKLYLLLNGDLSREGSRGNNVTLRKVFPLHRPPRVTHSSGRGIGQKARATLAQVSYMLFRLRFHIAEGSRYLLEAQRWKRIMSASDWNANQLCPHPVGGVSAGNTADN